MCQQGQNMNKTLHIAILIAYIFITKYEYFVDE